MEHEHKTGDRAGLKRYLRWGLSAKEMNVSTQKRTRRRSIGFLAPLVVAVVALGPAADAAVADDPYRPDQWALSRIGAEAAWKTSTAAGVRIGIVDSGVDLTHEDLVGKVIAHTSCIGSGGDPGRCTGSGQDDNGHGTHVAGIAAAATHNGNGVAGVAPDAELVVAKALDANGTGTVEDVVAGIKWVVDHGARVVNLSVGDANFVFTSLFGTPMAEGVEYAWSHGAIPVLASGNENLLGFGSSNYGDLNAVVVGATGPDDEVAWYSSPSGNAKWAVVAPGGAGAGDTADDVFSTFWVSGKANQYRTLAGTSMAAPHVAGALALLLGEGLDPQVAVARLLDSVDPKVSCGSNSPTCRGRLDIARAVIAPAVPSSPSAP